MRWLTVDKRKRGDTKIVEKFSLFPKRLKDGYTVWLEKYYAKYRWRVWNDPRLPDEWVLDDTWSKETHHKKIEERLLYDDLYDN